jgi:hypothetical protein
VTDDIFDIVRCSWPQVAGRTDEYEVFEPDWEAPSMPNVPQTRWEFVNGEYYLAIDWRNWFRSDLKCSCESGQMRGFYIVFQLRINENGTLNFWSNKDCLVRHNGNMIEIQQGSDASHRR